MIQTTYYQSPLGTLELIATEDKLLSTSFKAGSGGQASNPVMRECVAQLDAYFKGDLKSFSIPYQLTGTEFQNKVWQKLAEIPYGKTISYSDLAIQLGDLKRIRAVGTANGKNKLPIIIPCHRVIGKDGSLVGFSAGLHRKKWLLAHEGVIRGEQIEIFA